MEPIGLYIHVPFCRGKCPYCDFYSLCGAGDEMEPYTNAVCAQLRAWGNRLNRTADTLYFGGGTPSVLGAERLVQIIRSAGQAFSMPGAQITVECNPSSVDALFFQTLAKAGVNRISMGLQSAVTAERNALGRRTAAETAKKAVQMAQAAGIPDISLDLMLGIPNQTQESISESIAFCADLGVTHISAYLLKIEPGTPFAELELPDLPDEDAAADFYLHACTELKRHGYWQYEISNFSKPGYESRHNLKYWNAQEYLGIGPSAHSMLSGSRFYYGADLKAFLEKPEPAPDGAGGSFEEYAMLRLRLNDGLSHADVQGRFGHEIPEMILKRAARFQKMKLLEMDESGIRLTREGMLLSNQILAELL